MPGKDANNHRCSKETLSPESIIRDRCWRSMQWSWTITTYPFGTAASLLGRALCTARWMCTAAVWWPAWIGFENNSITGITDLLYTLLDDHTEEAARYGVELTPELFPSRFIPTSIRTDHGAEYESKEFSRMCKEMGINHHFVAPATGSLKGTVEQFFPSVPDPDEIAACGCGRDLQTVQFQSQAKGSPYH